jgi:hypothetical protein
LSELDIQRLSDKSRSFYHSLDTDNETDITSMTNNNNELDGTRVKLGCGMRCEAGSNIDEREIENS